MPTQSVEINPLTILSGMESYITKLQERSDKEFQQDYPNTWANGNAPKFEFTEGKIYFKVVKFDPASRAAFCFVDRSNGNIYKGAGWNKPAKGVRGNIFNDTLPLTLRSLYR